MHRVYATFYAARHQVLLSFFLMVIGIVGGTSVCRVMGEQFGESILKIMASIMIIAIMPLLSAVKNRYVIVGYFLLLLSSVNALTSMMSGRETMAALFAIDTFLCLVMAIYLTKKP